MKIAIQGIEGSFHHQAVKQFYPNKDIIVIGKSTFSEVFESLKDNEADIACVAIENAIFGSLYENYDLLRKFQFHIIGELFLKINHNLIALPNESLQSITKVMSHPVALKQCENFLSQHNFQIEEFEDTALAVRRIKENNLTNTAAIASSIAAELYDMKILEKNIQDQANNYTRFLFLSKEPSKETYDKISLNFKILNKPGSLLQILKIISNCNGNMSKLESRPILGEVWQYQFYVDVVIDPNICDEMLKELKSYTEELTVLGRYKQGEFVE